MRVTIPLYLVTGFLGAGKTTLIAEFLRVRAAAANAVATDAYGQIGLLVNELGAVGIDGELLGDGISTQVELPGGCVCCALGDDLAKSIVDMVTQRPALSAIILETTGVAEPLPIAWALERPPLAELVRLGAVITCVDAENFLASRAVSASVDAQIAYADVLLLTKAELVAPTQRVEVARVANAIAARALWYEISTHEAAVFLDTIVRDPSTSRPVAIGAMPCHVAAPDHQHGPECGSADIAEASHAHGGRHGITSLAFTVAATPVDRDDLEDAINALPLNIVRIKGIVLTTNGAGDDDAEAVLAFHRVGPRYSCESLPAAAHRRGPVVPRVVVLGYDLDRAAIAAQLAPIFGGLS
jgi:G3E family GTPase